MTPSPRGCVLDTDVLIGALDRADAHHDAASRLLLDLIAREIPLLVSSINYAETLVRPAEDETTLARAVVALDGLGIAVDAPSGSTGRDAARIRRLGVSLADGFALATATQRGWSIASFDRRVRRAAAELGVPVA